MLSITTEQIQKVHTLHFFFSKKLKCGHARYGFFFFFGNGFGLLHAFVCGKSSRTCLSNLCL